MGQLRVFPPEGLKELLRTEDRIIVVQTSIRDRWMSFVAPLKMSLKMGWWETAVLEGVNLGKKGCIMIHGLKKSD